MPAYSGLFLALIGTSSGIVFLWDCVGDQLSESFIFEININDTNVILKVGYHK